MATPYFRQIPNFRYVSRIDNAKIGEYVDVKNLFKRGKLNDDIFENLVFFEKYQIVGDERPDNVAYKLYDDETLDWVILLSNNILNIQTEWPIPQKQFDEIMLSKYGSYDNLYSGIHHYETVEIKNSLGNVILPSGIKQPNNNTSFDVIDKSIINSIIELSNIGFNKKLFITTTTPLFNLSLTTQLLIEGISEDSYNGRFTVNEFVTPLGSQPTYLDLLPLNPISEIGDIYLTTIPDDQLWIFTGSDWINLGPAYYQDSQIVSSFIITVNDPNFDDTLLDGSVDATNILCDSESISCDQDTLSSIPQVSTVSLGNNPILNRISSSDYLRFYDAGLGQEVQIPSSEYLLPVTNYEYESNLEDEKRNIYILKPQYLNVILNDIEDFMDYKKGATQYVSSTIKIGDNIRLYN
jgi:hypothetical protein